MQHLVSSCGRLRAPALALVGALATAPALASPDAAGRWEGVAAMAGQPLRLVVDLDHDAQGRWGGSVILPGRGVKGVALDDLAVGACDVRFALNAAFANGAALQPVVALACQADGSLAGRLTLGGHSSAVTLRRSGAPQVDRPPASSLLDAALAGRWTGRYELGGYAREVTLTLANREGKGGGGQLVIVGKRTTTLEVDHVTQGREYVTVRASGADFTIEGRFEAGAGVIEGGISQGPFEAPIVLRRQATTGEKTS